MPLSSEALPNRPLSGKELQEVIEKDLHEVLDRDGMFTEYVAYGRVSYSVEVILHLDNMTYPGHNAKVRSKRGPGGVGAIEPEGPLVGASEEALKVDLLREREVVSPNALRIEKGMPIQVQAVQDGRLVDKQLRYEARDLPEGASGSVKDTDKSVGRVEVESAKT